MSKDQKVELKLSDRPDGYGFFYGTASLGDEFVNVSVMPPKDQWNGDIELDGYKPYPKQWILMRMVMNLLALRQRPNLKTSYCPA